MQPEQSTTTTPSVSQIKEHPRWKLITREEAELFFEQGTKACVWNLHSSSDVADANRKLCHGAAPGWGFCEDLSMVLGGDRTAYWIETE